MIIKDLEKMLNKYKQVNASIFCVEDSKKHSIKIEGNPIDVLYLFTELVKGLKGEIPTTLLKLAFALGLEDEENE